MNNLPSHPSDDDPDEEPSPSPFAGTPFEELFASLARGDMSGLQSMFGQLQRMFAPHEGAVNWEFAHDLARQVTAQHEDRSPDAGDVARLRDVAQLAEHWLDGVTELPAGSSTIKAWSRAEWLEASMPLWRKLVEPIASNVVRAMGEALPSEAAAMAGPMIGLLNQMGAAMFSQQVGQAVGELSTEVISASDIGLPVGPSGQPAVVLTNVTVFGEGLGLDASDVLLYVVLRECAHQRLFAHAPWLRGYLTGLVEEYGRGITIDTSRIEASIGSLDPTNIEAVQEALSGGLFEVGQTPGQQAALTRLETALALVEGWVDEVVGQAADEVMPQAGALREAMRRRRATGGPAEATFAALVGLELRPRRLRDAAALWGALRSAEGPRARDAVWAHPDLLPTSADLDDPLAYAQRTREADELDITSAAFDEALAALLERGRGDQPEAGGGARAAGADRPDAGDEDGGAAEPKRGPQDADRPDDGSGPPTDQPPDA
ncbi:MAG TPA: zinc-dependent metalloprotease [Nocardioidaceae bacterium]|nr:zinc-dependent metalloprotease [Nocardioidaceae bacterium]